MRAIKTSIWYLLIYNKLFLGVLSVFALFTMAVNILGQKTFFEAMGLILQLFIFLGVYLGGSLIKLKRNYLWKINNNYKNSILHGYFIILFLANLCFAPFLWKFSTISPLIIIMPFCISAFAAHLVLGKNVLYKIIIPAIPILLFQASKLGVGFNSVLLLIVVASIVLAMLMYKNIFYQYSEHKTTAEQQKANSVAFMTTGLNHKHLNKINGVIGVLVSKWIMYGKRNLDWAVLMPYSRLTFMTLFYVLFILFFLSITDDNIQKMIGTMTILILPNLFLGLVMESRNLLKQIKFFSHVFIGENHKQLKNRILLAMDKNMLINAIVYVGLILLMIKLLGINISLDTLITSMLVIIFVSLAIYPVFMCLSWINISVILILALFVYAAILYKTITWVSKNPELATTIPFVSGFIICCFLLRSITQYVFWQRSMESLLSNK